MTKPCNGFKRTGKGRPDQPCGLSCRAAKDGIQPHGIWENTCPHTGCPVRLGRKLFIRNTKPQGELPMKYFRSTQYPIEFVLSEHINKNFFPTTMQTITSFSLSL